MTTPAQPDPLDDINPTDAEVKAAAEAERRDADSARRAAAKTPAPAKRGPGRPPGAKNRGKAEQQARTAAKTTEVRPARPLTGATASSARETAARKRDERKRQVDEWTKLAAEFRPALVTGVGMVTGIPAQYLVGIATDEAGRPLDEAGRPLTLDERGAPMPGQNPMAALTPYGEALAPASWQIRAACEAGVRLVDSEVGEKLAEAWERYSPHVYGVAALAALGIYTVSTLQAVNAIKPMIEIEAKQAAAAAAAANNAPPPSGDDTPGGSSAGPTR